MSSFNVMDFFNCDKPLQRIIYPRAQVNGELEVQSDAFSTFQEYGEESEQENESETNYAEEFRQQEEEQYMERCSLKAPVDDIMNRPDTPTTLGTFLGEAEEENLCDVFSKYKFEHDTKPEMVIDAYVDLITDMIDTNPVVVIQGPTGCGKSTQVPQYILNACQQRHKYCKIAVTQPRRIAAITVAKRVCEERGWPLGSVCGYQVGLDMNTSEDTILTYMTTGVLLHQLVTLKNMNQYTHIVLDEVHERDQEMDFLLLVVKRFQRTVSPRVKITLMSATFDVEHFSTYFSRYHNNEKIMSPIIDIAKGNSYTVHTYYLNQFLRPLGFTTCPKFSLDEPKLDHSFYQVVVHLLQAFDRLDEDDCGSVLIFLPGIYEIEELYDELQKGNTGSTRWHPVPLHSSITIEEQRMAFEKSPPRHRKIILSTNIAESSVTVPDVVYVIDFCLTKVMVCDPLTNYTSLKLSWAAHTNCIQRAGRVGRVRCGRVYRFVTELFYNRLEIQSRPEILRAPLHRLVLMSKILDLDMPPHGILALAIDPPDITNIKQTIAVLKEVGGLLTTHQGSYIDLDGDLTFMGRIMAQLPLDVHCSKLVVLGYMYNTLRECIIMAAAMSLQNIFSSPFHQRLKAYTTKLSWADGSCSDIITYLHVYIVWEKYKYNGMVKQQGERKWMLRNFLQPRVMKEWRTLVTDLKQRLANMGITEPLSQRADQWNDSDRAMMLKVVIAGAFYPNYFVRSSEGGQVDEGTAVKTLGGRDPYTTVYFSGKPQEQPGELYVSFIRDLLADCGENMQITFDSSSKVYVHFKSDKVAVDQNRLHGVYKAVMPGKIATEVYRAVKYRQLKLPTSINCMHVDAARKKVADWKKIQLQKKNQTKCIKSILPSLETIFIELQISYVNDPSHFYAHNVGDFTAMNMLREMRECLNSNPLEMIRGIPVVGQLYAAPYEEMYYRARVVCITPAGDKDVDVHVIFIDYGNTACLLPKQLRVIPNFAEHYSPFALECVLSNIQPSLNFSDHAMWTRQAKQEFYKLTENKRLYGKVYSVVDDVVSLELYLQRSVLSQATANKSVNDWLLEQGFAQPASESFLSQENHNKRIDIQEKLSTGDAPHLFEEDLQQLEEMPRPMPQECNRTMTLKGPFSPLEMQIYSVLQCSQAKMVSVEWSSVNSVLLDSDPQNPHDRLLVAGGVGQSIDGTRLTLRHTTIMPNVHGLPALMALVFAPRAKLHVSKEHDRVSSLICGLGYNTETTRPYYMAHDMVLNLDFKLSQEDIVLVNEIREFMNLALQTMSCYKSEIMPTAAIENCQAEIRQRMKILLRTKRQSCEREILPHSRQWIPSAEELNNECAQMHRNPNDVWSMHSYIKLRQHSIDKVNKHLEVLHNMAIRTIPMNEVRCELCDVPLYEVNEIRVHLVTSQHLENERKMKE